MGIGADNDDLRAVLYGVINGENAVIKTYARNRLFYEI